MSSSEISVSTKQRSAEDEDLLKRSTKKTKRLTEEITCDAMEGVKMNAQEEDTSDGDKFMNDGDQECIPETQQSTGIPTKGSRYAVLNEDGITEIDTEEQNECEEVLSIPEGENNRLNKQGNLGGKGKRPAVIVSENQIMGQKEQPPQMHIGGAESSKNKDRVNRGIKGRTSNQAAASDEHTVVIATDHGNKVTRTTVNINKEGPMMHGVLELNMNEHHNDPPNGDDVHMVDSTVIANGSVGSGTSPVGLNASLA
nr:uncharacterized protein LOC109158743 [Ipomoea batatas]GMC90009.1 uncharacterized protein LOC109158743 [Ipomoea batatas]